MTNTDLRTPTWERIGADISEAKHLSQALELANLGFNVKKVQLQLPSGNPVNRFACVQEGTENVLGIVGADYKICQNEQAFEFVNYISDEMKFVKAGMLGRFGSSSTASSPKMFVITRLPEHYVLGDSVQPYIIFENGFDGRTPIRACITPLRLICQNQFAAAFRNSTNSVYVKHYGGLEENLATARQVLRTTANYMDTFNNFAEELVSVNLKGKINRVVEQFYPVTEDATDRIIEKVQTRRDELINIYNNADNQNFRNTGWGLINAFADQNTHQTPGKKNNGWEERMFMQASDPKRLTELVNIIKAAA